MKRVDPFTKEEFIPLRRNQLFKSYRNRIAFNNEKAARLREAKSKIDKILLKNFRVLSDLVKNGETKTFPARVLTEWGFDSKVFTHLDLHAGDTCHCLYNFIFPKSASPDSIIIKNRSKHD